MKSCQKGLATLVVVSGVLLIVGLFALSVVRSGFGDIHKAQNLVRDAKQRAKAKAALDCAIARFEQLKLDPRDTNFKSDVTGNCVEVAGADKISVNAVDDIWMLAASSEYAVYRVVLLIREVQGAAFKTSGNLKVTGGNLWIPARGEFIRESDGIKEYACTAIIAGGSVTIDVENANADFKTVLSNPEERCEESQFSTVVEESSGLVTGGFESDILPNTSGVNLFRELFGEDKDNWREVKKAFHSIETGSATSSDATEQEKVKKCGESIKGAAEKGHTLIWVTGDCLLDDINGMTPSEEAPFIVVQNGVVGASTAIDGLKGTIYQFTHGYSPASFMESWGAYVEGEVGKCKAGAMNTLCAQFIDEKKGDVNFWGRLPFYFHGAFTSQGAYFVDVPDSTAIVNGAFILKYDENVFQRPLFKGAPQLVKGSYHDF